MGLNGEVKTLVPDESDETLRDWLKNVLVNSEVSVSFEKKDGTLREMRCTLNPSVVTPYEKKTERTRSENDSVLSVFDLDKNDWRSFRLDSVRSVKVEL